MMKENDWISWKKTLRWPEVEPGSTAWKAAMLTAIPPTLDINTTKSNADMLKLKYKMISI